MVILCAFIITLVSGSLCASEGQQPLTLIDALNLAKQQHTYVLLAQEKMLQAEARLRQHYALLLPQVEGMLSYSRQTKNLSVFSPSFHGVTDAFRVFDARLRLTQNILDPAAIKGVQILAQQKNVAVIENIISQQNAMAAVAALYLQAAQAKKAYVLSRQELCFQNFRHQVVQSRVRAGVATSLAEEESRAEVLQSRYVWHTRLSMLQTTLALLKAALNMPLTCPLPLAAEDHFVSLLSLSEHNPSGDISRIPVMQKWQMLVRERESGVDAARVDGWPKVLVEAEYEDNGLEVDDMDASYMLGLRVSLPLWDSGKRAAKKKEYESFLKEAMLQWHDEERSQQQQLAELWRDLKSDELLLKAKKQNMETAQSRLQLAAVRHRNGTIDDVGYRRAVLDVADAQDACREAQTLYGLACIHIRQALGIMEELL